jgi:hypothetical protein
VSAIDHNGGITIAKDYVTGAAATAFVPLRHDPGHPQVDFGVRCRRDHGGQAQDPLFCDGAAAQRRLFCALMFANPT